MYFKKLTSILGLAALLGTVDRATALSLEEAHARLTAPGAQSLSVFVRGRCGVSPLEGVAEDALRG